MCLLVVSVPPSWSHPRIRRNLTTRSGCARKAGKGEVDAPVSFGGGTFSAGDILRADADGVVLLPASASIR
ncbi:hypothetical protein [Streptomyces sp. NPDC047043]|uniref:RraA family protein n=1 Tax=Streptomyces sp. NPDC047043 TaxID=3154497 RepID=UPI0033F572C1